MIDLVEAVKIARHFEAVFVDYGIHVALTGSTLYKGWSEKDMDLVLFPHKTKETGLIDKVAVILAFQRLDIKQWELRDHHDYGDEKTVIKCQFDGVTVDLIW